MRLVLTPVAENDLARIYDFNIQRTLRWAERVERRLGERMEALLRTPNTGRPLQERGVRRLSITDIQYVIDYEFDDEVLLILRIRHSREIR